MSGPLSQIDPEVSSALEAESARQVEHLELIASENYASRAVMQAQGSCLTNKYAEGYPGRRYYGGCEHVDVIERLAIDRACKLFGARYANVQPHSGAQANAAAYFALVQPGDVILGMSLDQGGHLTHGSPANVSGKHYRAVQYGLNADGEIDYEGMRQLAEQHRPKMIIGGFSAYSGVVDWMRMREIADAVDAALLVDMAHVAGLVAAGLYPNPVEFADVVTTTTHKTLRGPRGGLILSGSDDEALHKKLNSAVFPGTQGGPLMHAIAAKAVCLHEAASPEFVDYQHQVRSNIDALCRALKAGGVDLVSDGSCQPSDTGGSEPGRAVRQGRRGRARPRQHHRQQEHRPQRPALALRHQRAAAGHAGADLARHGRGRDGTGRRLDRRHSQGRRQRGAAG